MCRLLRSPSAEDACFSDTRSRLQLATGLIAMDIAMMLSSALAPRGLGSTPTKQSEYWVDAWESSPAARACRTRRAPPRFTAKGQTDTSGPSVHKCSKPGFPQGGHRFPNPARGKVDFSLDCGGAAPGPPKPVEKVTHVRPTGFGSQKLLRVLRPMGNRSSQKTGKRRAKRGSRRALVPLIRRLLWGGGDVFVLSLEVNT